jgi:hypothetical protein
LRSEKLKERRWKTMKGGDKSGGREEKRGEGWRR